MNIPRTLAEYLIWQHVLAGAWQADHCGPFELAGTYDHDAANYRGWQMALALLPERREAFIPSGLGWLGWAEMVKARRALG